MTLGDLVCWHDKRALLGVVVKVAEARSDDQQWIACKVQWSNGVRSTHSSRQLVKLNIGEHMKNKLVKGIQSGEYGHATKVHNHKVGMDYIEVRMLDRYEHVHTCTIPSFYLYYEVLGDAEE